MKAPVVVIGAGVGGLACAIDLAARGVAVTLLERAAQPGGKMREVEIDGRAMDAGPTVFTMRWVFDELLDSAGTSLDAQLDLSADLDLSVDQIAAFAGPAEAARYRVFCARAKSVYDTLETPFLRSTRPNPLSLMTRGGLRGLPAMLRISPFATLWSALGQHFHDPRLRQLFGRYATYCGSSPFMAPATLMLVSHVERMGVWRVSGGMHRVAHMLASLAASLGVTLRYGAQADEILVDGRRGANGVRLAGGERIDASAVVFNGDAAALSQGLLGRALASAAPAAPRSLSALTWNLLGRTGGFELSHHNVFFGADSPREFADLCARASLPDDPTVYVCAQDCDGAEDDDKVGAADNTKTAVPALRRLLCLVNAPACDASAPDDEEIERCERRMYERLARCGLSLQAAAPPIRTTPRDFARLFPGSAGALYGAASHGWMASFRRPGSRTRIPGLYLAGGTTHPGPGVPMAALSGRLAASSLMADMASNRISMPTWRPADTAGGTSTHSATTAATGSR